MVMRLIKVALAGRCRLIEPPAYSLSPTMISERWPAQAATI